MTFYLCILILGVWQLACAAEIESAQGCAMLVQAVQKSRTASYIAVLKQPKLTWFPMIDKAVFYRRIDADGGVFLRTELFSREELQWVFLQNEKGKYAICPPANISAQGGDFLPLYYLACLMHQPYWGELEKCTYEIADKMYGGRKCRLLTVTTPGRERSEETDENEIFFRIVTENWNKADTCSTIKQGHPFVREYTLDAETGMIVALRKFNWYGKLIFVQSVGEVDFNPDWSKYSNLFETPKHIDNLVATTEQFVNVVKQKRLLQTQIAGEGYNSPKRAWNHEVIMYGLLAAGILLVGGAWWLRRNGRG